MLLQSGRRPLVGKSSAAHTILHTPLRRRCAFVDYSTLPSPAEFSLGTEQNVPNAVVQKRNGDPRWTSVKAPTLKNYQSCKRNGILKDCRETYEAHYYGIYGMTRTGLSTATTTNNFFERIEGSLRVNICACLACFRSLTFLD